MNDRLMRIIVFAFPTEEELEEAYSAPPGPERRRLRPLRRSTCPLSSRKDEDSLTEVTEEELEEAYSAPPGPERRRLRPMRRSTCPLSSRKNEDLLMEDLEQRIEDAAEALYDALTILENAGMGREKAVAKLISIMKSEIGNGEALTENGLAVGDQAE